MFAGSREFIAYARAVQRTQWARELERSSELLAAWHEQIELAQVRFGERPPVSKNVPAAARGPARES